MAVIGSILVSSAASTAIGVAAHTIAVASAMSYFLVSTAIGVALYALSPKPSSGSGGYSIRGESGSALDHQIIYGETKVGGVRVYDSTTGTNNQYLHRILAFAGHEIDSYQQIYINDDLVGTIDANGNVSSPSKYNGKVRIKRYYGTKTQIADTDLISDTSALADGKWTTNHKLTGIAYLYVRFKYDADLFTNGVPAVSAVIRGKKVYDPRTSTTAWSNNPALCLRDYLTSGYDPSTDFGFGMAVNPSRMSDTDHIIPAANICDQNVTQTPAGSTTSVTEKRYTCNGAFTTGSTPNQIISQMITSMGGILWYSGGFWKMKAASWSAPTITLTDNDLRSSVSVSTRFSKRDNFNTVKGTFRGSESQWQEADYPQVSLASAVEADGGFVNTADYSLAFTSSSLTAQRIARIFLNRNREQLTINASWGLNAFKVEVGDVVNVTLSRFGWTNKPFEVTSWTFGVVGGLDIQANITLREISSQVFDNVDGTFFESNNTTLPDPQYVSPLVMTVDNSLRSVNQQVTGVLSITVTADSAYVDDVEVEYKKSSDTTYIKVGKGNPGLFEVYGIEDDYYDIRSRAINYLGVRGPWVYNLDYQATPYADPPATPEDFTGNVVGSALHLSWTAVPDLDLSHYKIRYSSKLVGATYQNAINIVSRVARPAVTVTVPAKSGTYFIKAVDKLGNSSVTPASCVVYADIDGLSNLNVIENKVESPLFQGAKTNTIVLPDSSGNNYLTLDVTSLFDSTIPGNFDDAGGNFDFAGGLGTIPSVGYYNANSYVDLGAVYTSRIQYSANISFIDYGDLFDLVPGNFDARQGNFDGDPASFDDTSVSMQVSYTQDDPTGSPTWTSYEDFVVRDVTARAIRFRAALRTSNQSMAPVVNDLTFTVDMPDRTESASDISVTGTINIVYTDPFKEKPAVAVSAALNTGQYYRITNKTNSGFTFTVYNASGTVATNTVLLDYVAKGYGKGI